MRYHKIPEETVRRMPLYLRASLELAGQGIEGLSSRQLADYLGLDPWLVRKDFSYFGRLGKCGVGYDARTLIGRIKKVLRLDVARKAVLVAVGRLGSALLEYGGFSRYGLRIVGVRVEHVDRPETAESRGIDMGIVAVAEGAAQEIANALLKARIRGFCPLRRGTL
jgi:redox-sensing transcriptional repressor